MFSADPLPPWCCLSFVLAGNSVQGWNTDDGCSAPILLSFYLSSHHLHPPPPMFSLYTYSTFCLLNWFPASCLSFQFYSPHLDSFPHAAALCRPKFCIHSPLPSIHLYTWPRSLFPAAQSITYHVHYQAQFLLLLAYFNLCVLTNSSSLILPSAFPCVLPVSSGLASCFCSFSICPLPCSFGGPPAYYLTLFFSVSLCSASINSWSMWVREVMRCEIWFLYLSVCLWHRARLTHRITLEDMVLSNYLVYSTMLYRSRVHAQRQKSQGLHLHLTPMSTLL